MKKLLVTTLLAAAGTRGPGQEKQVSMVNRRRADHPWPPGRLWPLQNGAAPVYPSFSNTREILPGLKREGKSRACPFRSAMRRESFDPCLHSANFSS